MTPVDVAVVPTPRGPARLLLHPSRRARTLATLVLGHGAGGGAGSTDLALLASRLPDDGVEVVLVEQPWRVAGRRVAPAPTILDEAWRAVLSDVRERRPADRRIVVGGRSAGARVACRTAVEVGAAAVCCLAFPLHPPGRPDRSRADELARAAAAVPVTIVQGERDPFGGPGEIDDAARLVGAPVATVSVAWADHAFAVPSRAALTRAEALEVVVAAVRSAVVGVRAGIPPAGNAPAARRR